MRSHLRLEWASRSAIIATERPDERSFEFDPVELARQRRPELVVAGLTIIRSYIAAGRPMKGKIADVGSFEDWTIIREILAWLDQPDPAVTRKLVLGDDPTRHELSEIMNLWNECFGNKAMSIADVGREIEKTKTGNTIPNNSLTALETALKRFSGNTEINARAVGRWFKRNSGVIVEGRHFERDNSSGRNFRYRLLCTNNAS